MDIITARLTNPQKADAAPVEVRFTIEDYEDIYQRLSGVGIGDPALRDCRIAEISGVFATLSELRGQSVNVDELDYLAKRLDSFFEPEALQFEGMAAAKGITGIEDFINLTFCCQQATVISEFSDLRAIGREHYLNTHGGSAPVSELDALDSEQIARELMQNQTGIVTPYGVAYDNGMELERLYKGREFPAYLYDNCVLIAKLTKKSEPDAESTWLYLPVPEVCVERALVRGKLGGYDDMNLALEVLGMPSDIFRWIDPAAETPESLNEAAAAIAELDDGYKARLCAAAEYTEPKSTATIRELAERLDLFDFYPGVSSAEEYGRFMIAESGHFEYDAELDEFYDFEGYGNWRLQNEQGEFLESGYIRYMGAAPLKALFSYPESSPDREAAIGGMSMS